MLGIKAIASDIDGTLLNSKGELSSRTITAIQSVVKHGYKFIIATGRHYLDVENLKKQIGIEAYVVSTNGGIIQDPKGKQLKKYTLSYDLINKLRSIETAKSAVINMHQGNRWIFSRREEWVINKHVRENGPFHPEVFNWNDFNGEDVIKFFYLADAETLAKIEVELNSKYGNDVNIFLSCKTMLEVVTKEANKSNAIDFILSKYGLGIDDCISFGDGMNDLDMLSKSKIGIVMGNASDRLKNLLPNNTVIGSSDNDSVAIYIEENFLQIE